MESHRKLFWTLLTELSAGWYVVGNQRIYPYTLPKFNIAPEKLPSQ